MLTADILHMSAGNEESSYANNSFIQEAVIRKVQPILNETIKRTLSSFDGFLKSFNVADLGCSSGPNTLLVVSNIVDEVYEVCKEKNLASPQLHVYLNDLFKNDFNSIFNSLPMFYDNMEKREIGTCFISATPGSFYGRLFPDKSIHFFHSSYGLHWLSQVPKGLENNKLNIYMAKASPSSVFQAYKMQFKKDFTMFLESRSKEILHGGHMVLAFPGRSTVNPRNDYITVLWELLAKSLVDMVQKGLVQESKINTFNLPMYIPHEDEVRDLIRSEGSFFLDNLETFEINWNPDDTDSLNMNIGSYDELNHGKRTAKFIQAVIEPLLVTHFGNLPMDLLFKKFENYVNDYLATQKTKHFNIVISLRKI